MEEESLNIFPPSNSLSIDKIVFDKEPIINNNINILQVKNIILIDKTVQQSDIFFNSSNENTLAICYNSYTEREKLLEYLKTNFTTLDRIALIFHNSMMNNKIFLNEQPFFTEDDLTLFENNKDNSNNYSNNVSFILEILKTFQVKNIDFLACQSLEYTTWKKYYELLHYYTQTIVGASNDLTGNINYGGDWIMETTNEDIQNMYFNNNITNYSLTLGEATLTYSTSPIDNTTGDNVFTFKVLNINLSVIRINSFPSLGAEFDINSFYSSGGGSLGFNPTTNYAIYYRREATGSFTKAASNLNILLTLGLNQMYEFMVVFETAFYIVHKYTDVTSDTVLNANSYI